MAVPTATAVRTADAPAKVALSADRAEIRADGQDLSFVMVRIPDRAGVTAPRAGDHLQFKIDGPGEIVATDNGDPTNLEPFPAPERDAFNGYALAIVRAKPGRTGAIKLSAESGSLQGVSITLHSVAAPK